MNLEIGKLRDNKAKEMRIVSSLEVSEMVLRKHNHVMRDLYVLEEQLGELNFGLSSYM